MIGVILASRGLIFTEVEIAIEQIRQKQNIQVFRSYNLPIPDAQNTLIAEALKNTSIHKLLFIEEDTIIPDGGFEQLDKTNADIACIDYSVNGWGCVTKNKQGEILWCGLGCT